MNSRLEELEFLSIIIHDLMNYPDHNVKLLNYVGQSINYLIEKEVITVKERFKSEQT